MARKQRKILIGKESEHTYFGRIGCSHSIYHGGYNNYIYGIKGIIALQVYVGWGEYRNSKI